MKGLIQEQIAFSSKIDVSKCPSVQKFIEEKVRNEDFVRWCNEPEPRLIQSFSGLPSRLYEKEKKEPWYQILTAIIP